MHYKIKDTILIFNYHFDDIIKFGEIPNFITKLIFNDKFNKPIQPNILPKTLTNITFGRKFNQDLIEFVLPKNLKSLTFGEDFNRPIKQYILPKTLESISFGRKFKQNVNTICLPKSIKSINYYNLNSNLNISNPNIIYRPTFILNDCDIRACGITFYTFINNELYILLLKYVNYEDFGGKTDKVDKNVLYTASRETVEESNGFFDKKTIYNKLLNSFYTINRELKYCSFYMYIPYISCNVFSDIEYHINVKRSVEWINIHNLKYIDLNMRLKYDEYFKHLHEIKE
jgi:hypothetical protein